MEPFGLLNLLKTLFPNEKNEETHSESAAPKENSDSEKEETPSSPLQTPNNAFLDFASRHDERAKRIKKP